MVVSAADALVVVVGATPVACIKYSMCVDTRVFMTVAVDLVIEGIQEPVRFLVETRAKIFPTGERFWYFTTKPHVEQFILKLKEASFFSIFIYLVKIRKL